MPRLFLESGRRIWYEDEGEGPPLVLLHGWCMSSQVWRSQRETLRSRFRVIAPDLAGHGRSDASPDGFHLSLLVADLEELFRFLALEDALLAGWSLGAHLALWGCGSLRARLSGLILVSGTPRFTACGDFYPGLDARELRGMRARMRRDPRGTLRDFVSGMFVPGECGQPHLVETIRQLLGEIPLPKTEVALQGLELLAEADLRALLQDVEMPTLIMGGDRDGICLPGASAYMAQRIPESSRVIFSGCGHAPFLTRCTEFNDAITTFSRRILEQAR
jgi:pimeloyl-[acyl-carrier protein] methyl ester esterase